MFILQFTHKSNEGEYIILTEETNRSLDMEHAKPDYELYAVLEFEVLECIKGHESSLPTDTALVYER